MIDMPDIDGYTCHTRTVDLTTGIGVVEVTRTEDGTMAEIGGINLHISVPDKIAIVLAVFSLITAGVTAAYSENPADPTPPRDDALYFKVLHDGGAADLNPPDGTPRTLL